MAPNGVCHFSRYCVAAVAFVTVTFTTTLSLFARLWRSGATLIVSSPAAAASAPPGFANAPAANAAPMIDFQFISVSQRLS
jgi:hypothetical protein